MRHSIGILTACIALVTTSQAYAFCGFYVAKAESKLFNKASKVVLAHHDNKHVITMASDYQGELKEFAVVIPVPTKIEKEQVHVTEHALVEHLDAYTAPRLVEYFDKNPCERRIMRMEDGSMATGMEPMLMKEKKSAAELGVKIEAEYTVGEYDIVILSAEQSDGLTTWLVQNGYKMPEGAESVLGSYIKQDMKFFLAKVNLQEQGKLGYTYLRPLQVAYESHKFMLPLRLGTLNANGPQELFIFTLSRNGRVEPANYRTVRIPSDMDVPLFVKSEFGPFYKAMFDEQVRKTGMKAVFLEYAWDMGWCDPCAADPLSNDQLRELGVFWLDATPEPGNGSTPGQRRTLRPQSPAGQNVFVTRMHVRYDATSFPEDIMFQETADRQNFQGRYVMRHPWKGDSNECADAQEYFTRLPTRYEQEAQNLSKLTGWEINVVRGKMESNGQSFVPPPEEPWYKELWQKGTRPLKP